MDRETFQNIAIALSAVAAMFAIYAAYNQAKIARLQIELHEKKNGK